MATNKRITDLTDYTSVMPYASELFGVYQPMIGWRSSRQQQRLQPGFDDAMDGLLHSLAKRYVGDVSDARFDSQTCEAAIGRIGIGHLLGPRIVTDGTSQLLTAIAAMLPPNPPAGKDWNKYVNPDQVQSLLDSTVKDFYVEDFRKTCSMLHQREYQPALAALGAAQSALVQHESALGAALLSLSDTKNFALLQKLFYIEPAVSSQAVNDDIVDSWLNVPEIWFA